MYATPRIEAISTFVRNPNSFLDAMGQGPLHLTQRGHEAAVLISPRQWCDVVARLQAYQRSEHDKTA